MIFRAKKYIEDDGSVTLSLEEIDLVVNGFDEQNALDKLIEEIKEYFYEFIEEKNVWMNATNRRSHIRMAEEVRGSGIKITVV